MIAWVGLAMAGSGVRIPVRDCKIEDFAEWGLDAGYSYHCRGLVRDDEGRSVYVTMDVTWMSPRGRGPGLHIVQASRDSNELPFESRKVGWGIDSEAEEETWQQGGSLYLWRTGRNPDGWFQVWMFLDGAEPATLEDEAVALADAVRFSGLSATPLPPPVDLSNAWVDLPPADCAADATSVADGWIGLTCTAVVKLPEHVLPVPVQLDVRVGFVDEARVPESPLAGVPSRHQGREAVDTATTAGGFSNHSRMLTVDGRQREVVVRVQGESDEARAAAARYVDAVIWPDL